MPSDNFSQKEILLQVMTELREIRTELSDQKILLQTHVNSSLDRDKRMNDLKVDVDRLRRECQTIKDELDRLTSSFRFFRFKVTMIAGIVATAASLLGQKLLEYIF